MRKLVADAGLLDKIEIDSAGTGAWHVGEAPDKRAQQEARRRGIDIGMQRARAVHRDDFPGFDYIVAMDHANLRELKRRCPEEHVDKLRLCLSYAPQLAVDEVPDPYYGGPDGFREVFDLVEAALAELLKDIQTKHLA